jgi:hypothetical protein
MPRLTKQQLKQHRADFGKWHSPQDLLKKVDDINDSMNGDDFFNQPGLTFVREAWAASKFALERKAESVRLAQGEFPDFELRIGTGVEQWEFTEADVVGRQRGLEYRRGEYRGGDYINQIEQAPAAIKQACESKAGKRYTKKVGLLVLLNIPSFGARQEETLASFSDSTAPAKDAFSEVWVLWNNRAYPVWNAGQRVG